MDVKKEITNATMMGIAGKTSTPETGKCKLFYLVSGRPQAQGSGWAFSPSHLKMLSVAKLRECQAPGQNLHCTWELVEYPPNS